MRDGFASLPVLGCLIVAIAWSAVTADVISRRHRAFAERMAAVQAEEYALGLRSMPTGTTLKIGPWSMRRSEGLVEVNDVRGWLRRTDDGRGCWEPNP